MMPGWRSVVVNYYEGDCINYCFKQVLDSRGHLLVALGYGLWPSMVLISEIVQTFILADFCYYYIKRFVTTFIMCSIQV